jgi:hypothetical protein
MATTVALGFYAICFPNPIGTSGGASYQSTLNTGFSAKSSLLPQSCLGITLTTLTGTASTATTVWYRGTPAAAGAATA